MDAPQLLDEMPPRNKRSVSEAPSATKMDDLQDDILPIIASFLPAHDAVRTCVLAKRWRHVWTCAPALCITAVRGFGSAKFIRFVERLLFLRRQGPCPLNSCTFDLVETDFDSGWSLSTLHVYQSSIQHALDCQVQSLCCSFTPSDPNNFAQSLPEPAAPLFSQHIRKLELCCTRAALDFSGCPALADLQMHHCLTLALNMVSDSLEQLSMNFCGMYMHHRTLISLPKLVQLELIECGGRLPLLENLPALEKAIIRLGEYPGDVCSESDSGCGVDNPCGECRFSFEFDADRGRSYFFQGLSGATHLELSACYNHAYILQRDLKWRPTFPLLKTLVLDDWCLDNDLSAVIFFIKNSPNLEELTFELFEEFDISMVTTVSNHQLTGAFETNHLNMVEIKCEEVDARIYKVLEILSVCGISDDKIHIRQ